jgi:hypothetical protein
LTIALALLAYELAGEEGGAVLGTALAIMMIAYVSIAPLAAGLLAGLPRRAVLASLDLVRGGIGRFWPASTWCAAASRSACRSSTRSGRSTC